MILTPYTLIYKDKKMEEVYHMTYTKSIFNTLVGMTVIRLVRVIISNITKDDGGFTLLLPEY